MPQRILRIYANKADADAAVEDLKERGFRPEEVFVVAAPEDGESPADSQSTDEAIADKIVLGYVVTVHAPFGTAFKATVILDRHHPVEFRNVSSTASAWEANSEAKRLIDSSEPTAASPPPIESIPEQERTGTRFGMDDVGRIDVLRTPPTTDDLQRLHYDEMRHKAEALSELGQMLGDVARAVSRILDALPERIEDASIDRLWSRANTLRRRHDAHVRSTDSRLGPDPARLPPLVAENLGDFLDSFNVYVIGDPRGLELDRIRLGPQDRETARRLADLAAPIARAASEPDSPVTPLAGETLSEQVAAAADAPDDINGDQAAELARKTAGNFVSELLRRAYAPVRVVGAFVKSEAIFAQKEARAGFYHAGGAAAFVALPGYLYWPELSSFVVRHADALKAFVSEFYQNPKLVEIIDLIVKAANHI